VREGKPRPVGCLGQLEAQDVLGPGEGEHVRRVEFDHLAGVYIQALLAAEVELHRRSHARLIGDRSGKPCRELRRVGDRVPDALATVPDRALEAQGVAVAVDLKRGGSWVLL